MTMLKQCIVRGSALSLICIATLAEANPVVVLNANNSGFGSLRQAVIDVNQGTYDEIQFFNGLTDINLITALDPFTVANVKITGLNGLKISLANDPANVVFNSNSAGGTLYLSGNNAAGSSNWYGGIVGSAASTVIRLEQQTEATYLGVISGSARLIYQGAGNRLILSNASIYSGSTSIEGGILNVGCNNALPIGTAVNITLGGTLEIGAGFSQTLVGLTGLAGNSLVNIGNTGTLAIDSVADATLGAVISGAGNFVKQGSGVFTLSNSNTYTGSTQILDGTLKVDAPNALPQTSPITLESSGTLEIADNRSQTLQSISGNGGITIDNAATLIARTVADGTFAGNITTIGTGVFVKDGTNTLTLSGKNTGNLRLLDADGGIKIPTGGSWNGPVTIGAATLEMNGGTVTGAITGNGLATSILNITDTFTPTAAITNIGSVNVRQRGTLFLTNDIRGALGNVVNEGTLIHTTNTTRTIAGNFTQEASGTLNIGIKNSQEYSQIQVGGEAILNGGTMNLQLASSGSIKHGDVFDIITSTGGITNTTLPTVPKVSLLLGFNPIIKGNKLQLVVNRSLCTCVNSIPALNGIAQGIDGLAGNDMFNPLLDILNQQTSQHAFENKLEQLAPTGLNGIHTVIAQGLGGSEQILLRLDTMRTMGTGGALARTGYTRTGYAAGDRMDDRGSFAPVIFGNSTKQVMSAGLSGYNALTGGFGFLGDTPILEYFRVGLGATYGNTVVKQSNSTGSNITIGSTEGLAYGSATYGAVFLDAVLSAGINNYHGKRNITFVGPTATSAYRGFQYGAKVKTGFAIPCYQVEISPMAAVQYMHLNVGQYTEKGAGILNQHLNAMQTNTVRLSLGGRIANKFQEGKFFPEFHAFYLADVKNPQVIITSRFVDGGGSFNSQSVALPKRGVNVGASITAVVSDNFRLSGGYDLEAKKSFCSHSASLRFKFLF
jgi:autotransporter-associated beta strand protein